jgi:hypothetical protein
MMYKSQNVWSSPATEIHNVHRGTGRWEGRGIQEQHRGGFSNDEVKSDRRVGIGPTRFGACLASRYHVCLIDEAWRRIPGQ